MDTTISANNTGFENKPLRTVVENWLYTDDMDTRVAASLELRNRFSKTWPRPDWAVTGNFTRTIKKEV